MIRIEYQPDDLVLTIPRHLASSAYVQSFLARLRVDGLLERSSATQDQIEALSEGIKDQWWKENRESFLKGTSG